MELCKLQKWIIPFVILYLMSSNLIGQKNDEGFSYITEQIEQKSSPCPENLSTEKQKNIFNPQFKGSQKQKDSLAVIHQNALNGNASAQYQLGRIYFNGDFIEQSYYNAAKWFSKAASQHHTKAAYEMALLVESDYPHDQMLMSRYLILGLEDKKDKLTNDTLWVKGNEYFETEKFDLSSTYLKLLIEKFL